MAFQFTCPQGHLLEADFSAAGQQCTCPHCRVLFIIPAPPASAVPPAPAYVPPPTYAPAPAFALPPAPPHSSAPAYAPAPATHAPYAPAPSFVPAPPAAPFAPAAPAALPNVGPSFPAAPAVTATIAPAPVPVDVTKPQGDELLHIPCPNGHELDTPREMLNQEVLCPHCGEQFLLREKDSVEFKRRKEKELEAKERKVGQAWMNWAIVFAVLVVIGLLVLILASSK